MNRSRLHPVIGRVLVVIASVGIIVALRSLLNPLLGTNSPLVLFLLSVVGSAWAGGFWAGCVATLLGSVAGVLLFVGPPAPGQSHLAYSLGRAVPFSVVGVAISLFSTLMNNARRDAKRQAEALYHSQELQRQAFDNAKDFAIFTMDLDGVITAWNAGAERMFGYPADRAIGMASDELFVARDRAQQAPRIERETALLKGMATDDRWHLRGDGSRFFASGTVRPLHGPDGRQTGFVKVARDATAEHDARRDLVEARRRTEASLLAGEVGTYYWDIRADRVYGDKNFAPRFGVQLDDQQSAPLDAFIQAIHPDDRTRVGDRIRTTLGNDAVFNVEYRVINPAGERWVTSRGIVERDHLKKPVGWAGVVVDITDRVQAEQRLAVSEEQFRTLFDSMDQGYCIIQMLYDEQGQANDYRFLLANPAFEKQIALKDPVGRRIREMVPNHDEHWFSTYGRVVETGEPIRFTEYAQALDVHFDVYAFRVGDASQKQVAVIFTNVTERRRWEAALQASEERYRTLFTTLEDGFCVIEMLFDDAGRAVDYRFLEVNPSFANHTGLGDAVGQRIRELVPGIEQHWIDTYAAVAVTGVTARFTNDAPSMNDRSFDVTAFRIGGDSSRRVALLFKDISDRRRAERDLAEARRRVDAALIAGDIGVYVWDVTADRLNGDANFDRLFGLPSNEGPRPVGEYVAHIHPNDALRVMDRLDQCLSSGERYEDEFRVGADENVRWVVSRGMFETDPAGQSIRMLGTVIDVTDRRRAEAELTRTAMQRDALIDLQRALTRAVLPGDGDETAVLEEAARRVLHVLPAADGSGVEILERGTDGADDSLVFRAASGLLERHTGLRVMRGSSLSGLCLNLGVPLICDDTESDPRVDRESCRRVGVRSMLVVPLQRGGRFVGVVKFASARPAAFTESDEMAAGLAAGAIATALSGAAEAKAAEALLRSEAQFRAIADAMPQFVWVASPDGHHEYYNRRWYEYVGGQPGDHNGERWASPLHPDDRERSYARWQQSLASGEPYEVEYRFRRHDGVYRWFLGRALAVRDERGRVLKWYGTCTDIDEQKRLQQQYDALLESERTARTQAEEAGRMKDEFLATISHELRTPLTAIVGWSYLMTPQSDEETLTEGLNVIFRNAQSQSQLIEDILDVSRITSGGMRLRTRRVTLRDPIEAALTTVRTAADAKGVSLTVDLGEDVELTADPERLQQVFWNLIANAIKFTDKGGAVTIRVRAEPGNVVVEIADTGRGIAADFLPFVFDRFRQADMSSTRRHGGLGLGLSIVRHLVELHGGRVSADSPGEGQGSTFRVELPVGVRSPETGPVLPPALPTPPAIGPHLALAGRRVLILDDEPDARRVMQALLFEHGVQCVVVDTVAQAMSALTAKLAFDVVLSDIGLPEEDGYVFIRRLRDLETAENRSRLPAIALTAYTRPSDRASMLAAGFDHYLAKPVHPGDLLAALGELLAARTA